ncbi:DMT family transporter [Paenibacillus sp. IB182496]|uniref:DMT family transporter n=1 Tax=Paenibacillus sabuli TaxID=2772509 RepID=A0A927BP67_9BACL|nr:DMT family transporter [Paenibacillus sabuli]MBD2844182.1 DMT family transporter [Paenibacillus sabuli]
MGYVLLVLAALSWSFVGILVKGASTMLDSTTITFARFGLGIVFLGLFIWMKDRGFKLRFGLKWVWLGALGKCCNYFFENYAISIGYAYGNILVPPIQTVLLLIISVVFLKEGISRRGWVAAALCITGVLLISWNGMPLGELLAGGGWTTVLYTISACGVVFHVLSQKILIKEMDAGNMNFSVFLLCTLLMAAPLPWQFEWSGEISGYRLAALGALGLITGLSFYWFAQSLKMVPFAVAVIVSNCSVLFTILWSYLVYDEPITGYVLSGAGVCLAGLLLLNLPARRVRGLKGI